MIPEQTLLGYPVFGDNATKVEPDNNKKSNGWQQADVLPAEHMNWAWFHNSKGISDLNKGVKSMEKEINAVLASFGITPAELTNNQLLTAMRLNASFVVSDRAAIEGPLNVSGGTIRVMFTADVAGGDEVTPLTLGYNGQNIPVKVAKDGSLQNIYAHKINGYYKYLQSYTTVELFYDSVQFIVIGNPILLSGADYTIFADGLKRVNDINANDMNVPTGNAVFNSIIGFGTYQTVEFFTGKLWTDGKRIYGLVVDIGNLPNSGNKNVQVYVDVATVIKVTGEITNGTGYWDIPKSGTLNDTVSIYFNKPNKQIVITTWSDYSSLTGYAYIEYTKPN